MDYRQVSSTKEGYVWKFVASEDGEKAKCQEWIRNFLTRFDPVLQAWNNKYNLIIQDVSNSISSVNELLENMKVSIYTQAAYFTLKKSIESIEPSDSFYTAYLRKKTEREELMIISNSRFENWVMMFKELRTRIHPAIFQNMSTFPTLRIASLVVTSDTNITAYYDLRTLRMNCPVCQNYTSMLRHYCTSCFFVFDFDTRVEMCKIGLFLPGLSKIDLNSAPGITYSGPILKASSFASITDPAQLASYMKFCSNVATPMIGVRLVNIEYFDPRYNVSRVTKWISLLRAATIGSSNLQDRISVNVLYFSFFESYFSFFTQYLLPLDFCTPLSNRYDDGDIGKLNYADEGYSRSSLNIEFSQYEINPNLIVLNHPLLASLQFDSFIAIDKQLKNYENNVVALKLNTKSAEANLTDYENLMTMDALRELTKVTNVEEEFASIFAMLAGQLNAYYAHQFCADTSDMSMAITTPIPLLLRNETIQFTTIITTNSYGFFNNSFAAIPYMDSTLTGKILNWNGFYEIMIAGFNALGVLPITSENALVWDLGNQTCTLARFGPFKFAGLCYGGKGCHFQVFKLDQGVQFFFSKNGPVPVTFMVEGTGIYVKIGGLQAGLWAHNELFLGFSIVFIDCDNPEGGFDAVSVSSANTSYLIIIEGHLNIKPFAIASIKAGLITLTTRSTMTMSWDTLIYTLAAPYFQLWAQPNKRAIRQRGKFEQNFKTLLYSDTNMSFDTIVIEERLEIPQLHVAYPSDDVINSLDLEMLITPPLASIFTNMIMGLQNFALNVANSFVYPALVWDEYGSNYLRNVFLEYPPPAGRAIPKSSQDTVTTAEQMTEYIKTMLTSF